MLTRARVALGLAICSFSPLSSAAGETPIHVSEDGTHGAPVLNENGVAAFWFQGGLQGATETILTGGGSHPAAVVAKTNALAQGELNARLGVALSINDEGQIAYWAESGDGREWIMRGNAASSSVIASTDLGFDEFGLTGSGRFVSINASGRVAFEGTDASTTAAGIYSGDGGPVTSVITGNEWGAVLGTPWINDAGQVWFWSGTDRPGIFHRWYGGGTINEYNLPGLESWSPWALSVNQAGDVATIAVKQPSGPGVYANVSLIAGDPVYTELAAPSVNDQGMAFLANGPQGTGLYARFTSTDPVVVVGDSIDGQVVYGVKFSREGLNEENEVVFAVQFEDGGSGVYRKEILYIDTEIENPRDPDPRQGPRAP